MSQSAVVLDLFDEYRLSAPEAEHCRPPWGGSASAWVERHIHIPQGKNALPGPMRFGVTPYLRDIVDTCAQPWLREGVICSAQQLGKTLAAHALLAYWATEDRHGTAAVVMPDETMAKRIVAEKLRPLWEASPVLAAAAPHPDDLGLREFHLNNGMSVYLLWAGSASVLASLSIRFLILDEVDKYPAEASSGETDPISLAEARTRTFADRKILKVSTPTTSPGNIWQALTRVDEPRFFYPRCPQCGEHQRLSIRRCRWPDDVPPRRILRRRLAWYECAVCAGRWDDAARDEAVRAGVWRGVHPAMLSLDRRERAEAEARPLPEPEDRPPSVGWHVPALLSHFVPISETAYKSLAAKESVNPRAALQDFYNHYLAWPFDRYVRQENPREKEVLGLAGALPAGVLPAWAVAVTVGIDVQKVGFWFTVWAWGRDERHECALVQYGYLPTWADVEALCFETAYPVEGAADRTLAPWRVAIDTGGGATDEGWSRTAEIYGWLRDKNRDSRLPKNRVWGVKGQGKAGTGGRKVSHSVIDKIPGTKHTLKGGIVLWTLDVSAFKEDFHARLDGSLRQPCPGCQADVPLADPGCPECGLVQPEDRRPLLRLHRGTGGDFVRQLLAEERRLNRRGQYEWVQVHRDNHLLDATVYAHAAADPQWAGGVLGRRKPAPDLPHNQRSQKATRPQGSRWVNSWRR